MNIPFFTPKAIGSTLIGLGSMGGGGGAVYLYQMPKNGKDLLIKEGYVFLNTEEDYKGMFNDQKSNSSGTNENDLKNAGEENVKDKAEQYCKTKFATTLPSSSSSDYSSTKQKLISFCTTEGIQTVKARLIQNKQKNGIDEANSEDKGKAVFAIYRYSDDFIKWLKEDNQANSSLTKESDVSEYEKLKTACTNLLRKSHREITDKKYFNYGSGWCVKLEYDTIKDKIQKDDPTGSEKQQNDSDWNNLVEQGKNTQEVKKGANKANNTNGENNELDETSLKKLCEDDNIKSKLSDNDSYQEKYLVIKSVCKRSTSDASN